MPKIRIVGEGKRRMGLSVYVDDLFAFTVEKEDLIKSVLYARDEVSDEELDTALRQLEYAGARRAAIKMSVLRLQPEAAIANKLSIKGYSELTIKIVTEDLKEIGYIDDIKYSTRFMNYRMSVKPVPKKQLRILLLKNGISPETAGAVLSTYKADEYKLAKDLLRKKYGNGTLTTADRLKAVRYLNSRGFPTDIVMKTLSLRDSSDL